MEQSNASLKELALERIAALNRIKVKAWEYINSNTQVGKMLTIATKAEEDIAKIQGVLTDKVQHLVAAQVVHKLYDFDNQFPEPGLSAIVRGDVAREILAPFETFEVEAPGDNGNSP